MRRREALAGIASNLMIVSPGVAFGYQANSKISLGILGTGGRGRSCKNRALPAVAMKSAMMAKSVSRARAGVMRA